MLVGCSSNLLILKRAPSTRKVASSVRLLLRIRGRAGWPLHSAQGSEAKRKRKHRHKGRSGDREEVKNLNPGVSGAKDFRLRSPAGRRGGRMACSAVRALLRMLYFQIQEHGAEGGDEDDSKNQDENDPARRLGEFLPALGIRDPVHWRLHHRTAR